MNTDESSITNPPPQASTPPLFVDRGGELVARPPFLQENTHLRCFFLEAKRGKLQSVCDQVFNQPTRGALNFRPLSNAILLTFAKIDRIYSMYGSDSERGAMPEIDVAFWLPLLSEREGKIHLSWYMPYIFVDNPFAMATGREVYGFSKTIAQFQIPEKFSSTDSYWVETLAMERFQADSRSKPMRVLEVVQTGNGRRRNAAQPLDTVRSLYTMLAGEKENLSTQFTLGWHHFQNIVKTQEVQMVFLRQLRDIRNPAVASYQEIIEAPSRVARVHQGGFLPGSFELRLTTNASFPIAEELGLDPERNPVKGACWMDFDFFLDVGQTLWTPA